MTAMPEVLVDLLRPDGGGMMTLEIKRALVERTLDVVSMVERTLDVVKMVERTLDVVKMVVDRAPTMIAIEGLPRSAATAAAAMTKSPMNSRMKHLHRSPAEINLMSASKNAWKIRSSMKMHAMSIATGILAFNGTGSHRSPQHADAAAASLLVTQVILMAISTVKDLHRLKLVPNQTSP